MQNIKFIAENNRYERETLSYYVVVVLHVILQSNNMRGVYSATRFMDMRVSVANSSAMPGFLSMDYASVHQLIEKIEKERTLDKSILAICFKCFDGFVGGFRWILSFRQVYSRTAQNQSIK